MLTREKKVDDIRTYEWYNGTQFYHASSMCVLVFLVPEVLDVCTVVNVNLNSHSYTD